LGNMGRLLDFAWRFQRFFCLTIDLEEHLSDVIFHEQRGVQGGH
jgi:hypothetical protein